MQDALDAEFGKDSSDEEDGVGPGGGGGEEGPPPMDAMFCPACNKRFKSSKA